MRLIADREETVKEKIISKLKGIAIEIIPNETQREKKKTTLKANSVPMPFKAISSFLTDMLLGYQKWSRMGKKIFGVIMANFLLNWIITLNPQIQKCNSISI